MVEEKTGTAQEAPDVARARYHAQQTLVNLAVSKALDLMYLQKNGQVTTTLSATGQDLGDNKEAVLATLQAIPNEFVRLRTYNLLARENSFNLSLKSSGMKDYDSMLRKTEALGKADPYKACTDLVRITAVSDYKTMLDGFSFMMQHALAEAAKDNNPTFSFDDEGWFLRSRGLMSRVLKSNVEGMHAEIQCVPRQQARLASRITHKMFEVYRLLETASPDIEPSSEQIKEFVSSYNLLADALRTSVLEGPPQNDQAVTTLREQWNRVFATPRSHSTMTFDDSSELSESDRAELMRTHAEGEHLRYGPVFKNNGDVQRYAEFLHSMKNHFNELELEPLPDHPSRAGLQAGLHRLHRLAQVTHIAFMQDEKSADFKQLYVEQACLMNEKAKQQGKVDDVFPEPILRCMADAEMIAAARESARAALQQKEGR